MLADAALFSSGTRASYVARRVVGEKGKHPGELDLGFVAFGFLVISPRLGRQLAMSISAGEEIRADGSAAPAAITSIKTQGTRIAQCCGGPSRR